MDFYQILNMIPNSVQRDIIEFKDVKLKDGRDAVRVTLDRLLSGNEMRHLSSEHFVGTDCVCTYRYAPEIQHSYFYMV